MNRLILNLRSFGSHTNSEIGSSQPDSYFRDEYLSRGRLSDAFDLDDAHVQADYNAKQAVQAQVPSLLDSVLGNVGEPLRVWGNDELEGGEDIDDFADRGLRDDNLDENGV